MTVRGEWTKQLERHGKFPKAEKPMVAFITITPPLAVQLLERNTDNRPIRAGLVEELVEILKEGRWRCTHQGICFDRNGRLIDGQHRLEAIRVAGRAVVCMVTIGADPDDTNAIDVGRVRSTLDVARFSGIRTDHRTMSAVTFLYGESNGRNPRRISHEARILFYRKHREAFDFASGVLSGAQTRGLRQSPVVAAVAKAFYHVERKKLADFSEVYSKGIVYDSKSLAAFRLREFCLATPISSGESRHDLFMRALRAVELFAQGQEIAKLYPASVDPFPLPEQQVVETAKKARRNGK